MLETLVALVSRVPWIRSPASVPLQCGGGGVEIKTQNEVTHRRSNSRSIRTQKELLSTEDAQPYLWSGMVCVWAYCERGACFASPLAGGASRNVCTDGVFEFVFPRVSPLQAVSVHHRSCCLLQNSSSFAYQPRSVVPSFKNTVSTKV